MLRFVITAGGTEEDIDGVRKITNFSTGNLGWLILETLLKKFAEKYDSNFHVFYIHGKNAVKKELDESQIKNVTFLPITDAQSAYDNVCNVLTLKDIDFFIHSMAVSDFSFSHALNPNRLAKTLYAELSAKAIFSASDIESILCGIPTDYEKGKKISSSDSIFLALKPAPKIISQIKKLSPATYLIGFKLLRNVSKNELIQTAHRLAVKNSCDAVLANDLSSISENGHEAFLVKQDKIIGKADTKKAIAEMIVNHCLYIQKQSI